MKSVERALDVAVMVVKNGGSTAMADRTLANILKGCGQEGVSVVWRLDFVAARIEAEGASQTILRPIETVGLHLVRASAAVALGEQVADKGAHAVEIDAEIARIQSLPSPHSRWMMTLAAACAGAFFSRTAGGDWGAFGIACVSACVGQLIRGVLQARSVARIGVTMICALISGLIATAGLYLGLSQTTPATLVGSIVYMVPGVLLINGCIDFMSPRHMSVGIERLQDAALILLTLAIGVVLAYMLITGLKQGAV
jgi:uncharacterized membrane protein YjjP (DUF1212 family)